ncbi:MAG: MiaB/RimO family radical SAM methylthiotransferase [Candidatus Omnitrophica bacterium]|nr:MiaB/RimO family radical SAM methylthiotransferase [Candidatus Omnitrophota bacterium]
MPTIKFYTLGCKTNQYDTQSIRERFLQAGFKEIFNGKNLDYYLVNTCTVTHKADRDCRRYILRAHQESPKAKIIVTGCLTEKNQDLLSGLKINYIISKRFFPEGISNFSGHTRAFLKIQDGCDNFCSYCIVPFVRGRSRSRLLSEIVCEAKRLVENGFKEIVLTGICLGAYGRDLRPQISLINVIKELEKINGLLRIRLSSIEAGDVTDELIEKMSSSPKLCRHLHIPIQSGDDEILRKMNRRYTQGDYLQLIKRLKKKIPQIAITTDVLVGFPGEKEENFQNTVKLIKKILPLKTHIFPYSPREGTAAMGFLGKIEPKIIKKRFESLSRIAKRCSLEYQRRFLEKKMPVLIEERSKDNPSFWLGHTDNYLKVAVKKDMDLKNQLVSLRLKKIDKDCIIAELGISKPK